MNRRRPSRQTVLLVLLPVLLLVLAGPVLAQGVDPPPDPEEVPRLSIQFGDAQNPQDVLGTLRIVLLLTVLALAPAILVLMTAFTRIVVVFAFVRSALATQNVPPNQVLIGLAVFLTFFIMQPTFTRVNADALQPYLAGELDDEQALAAGTAPLREFMLANTREKDLALFLNMARVPPPDGPEQVPTYVLVPAFAISELKTAFQIGFLVFIPFLVIDMVVATTLMSMGMLMLPPMMVSLPFKILLFVLVDGWNLIVQQLVASFR